MDDDVREEMLLAVVDIVVVVVSSSSSSKEGKDVHRRTFAESDEKQQSSQIIDFVRRGTRRNGRG